jgi:hypothetical protein
MTHQLGVAAQTATQQLLSDLRLLSSGHLQPVFSDQATGLNSGQLSEIGIIVCGSNLDEEKESLGLIVEFSLQDTSGLLHVTIGSCLIIVCQCLLGGGVSFLFLKKKFFFFFPFFS